MCCLFACLQAVDAEARAELPRVLVLVGAGRAFCAGVDLSAASAIFTMDNGGGGGAFPRPYDIPAALRACPWPTIACVRGACYTGGLELALNCDVVLAASDAVFADTHCAVGIAPSWGLSQVGSTCARSRFPIALASVGFRARTVLLDTCCVYALAAFVLPAGCFVCVFASHRTFLLRSCCLLAVVCVFASHRTFLLRS